MDRARPGEPREKLISAAKAHGYDVENSLARWHRWGLLPTPWLVWPGRGSGSRSVYPLGSTDQLLALCRIHFDRKVKRLPYVAWGLWWEGFEVSMVRVRAFLSQQGREWDRAFDTTATARGDEDAVRQLAVDRVESPVLRQGRKRVGADDASTFIRTILAAARGEFEGYESADQEEIVEKGLGLTRGRVDRVGNTSPWLVESSGALRLMGQFMTGTGPLSHPLDKATDPELLRARDEVRLFLKTFEQLGSVLARIISPGAFGFTAFSKAIQALGARDQAFFVLVWLDLRSRPQLRDGLTEILSAASQWRDVGYPSSEVMEQLRAEIPAFEPLLSRKRIASAIRSKRATERLNSELYETGRLHREEVVAFLRRHPEAAELADRLGRDT